MNLIIDAGNTLTKVFVFEGDRITASYTLGKPTASAFAKIISRHSIRFSILSSVVKNDGAMLKLLRKRTRFLELKSGVELPFRNAYRSKETLGNDRIANAAGAIKYFPGKHCLVIDAGTCVKYDFVSNKKEYAGGAISPGLKMRFRALHEFTSKLPAVQPSRKVLLTGKTTEESMLSGVQMGMLNEMEGYISKYRAKYRNLKVILTGGDAGSFAHHLNFPIFAAPKLTAVGLNEILHHHLSKK